MANTGAYVAWQSETIYEISVPWEMWWDFQKYNFQTLYTEY